MLETKGIIRKIAIIKTFALTFVPKTITPRVVDFALLHDDFKEPCWILSSTIQIYCFQLVLYILKNELLTLLVSNYYTS